MDNKLEKRLRKLFRERGYTKEDTNAWALAIAAAHIATEHERAAVISFLCQEDNPDEIIERYATPIDAGAHLR